MPRLRYDYFTFPGETVSRPMAGGLVVNPRNQKAIHIAGLLDTGADVTTLMPDLLVALGIDPLSLRLIDVGGVTGTVVGGGGRCDFLRVALMDGSSLTPFFPNEDNPVPVLFVQGTPSNLFGRECFLDRGAATFDGLKGSVTLDFP